MKSRLRVSMAAVLVSGCFSVMNSQSDWCGSQAPSQQWEQQLQQLIASAPEADQKSAQNQVYVIPVIIHVIHGNQSVGTYPNLNAAQIHSQIRALNEDFGGVGYNYGSYPASAFQAWATSAGLSMSNLDNKGRVKIANCNIQFCLATLDTLGNPLAEPGIDRVNYVTRSWSNPASFNTNAGFKNFMDGTVKPNTIWNVTKYFNIWISDININAIGLLGYATFPMLTTLPGLGMANGTATTDGVWCYAKAFGSANTFPSGSYSSGNNYGRTLTHEAGHWLGLRHIWGDGTCASDYCDDTPPATGMNYSFPSYPLKASNCSNNVDGEMFMNFMDYTNDAAKFMFTPDQSIRMQTTMANSPYRKFMGTHNLCSVEQVPSTAVFNVNLGICEGTTLVPQNMSSGVPVPGYTWSATGGAFFDPDANQADPVIHFPAAGVYTLMLTTDNGVPNSSVKTVTVFGNPQITFSGNFVPEAPNSITVCAGEDMHIDIGGGIGYTVMPGNSFVPSIGFHAAGDITYTITTRGIATCTSSTELHLRATECTNISERRAMETMILFPNPFNEMLTVSAVEGAVVVISDASGREVMRGDCDINGRTTIKTDALESGVYFIRIQARDGSAKTFKTLKLN